MMRTEDDLRLALCGLERETPDAAKLLRQIAGDTSVKPARPQRVLGRRLIAGVAAATAIATVAVAAALVSTATGDHGPSSSQHGSQSVPRYYMALVKTSPNGSGNDFAVVLDRVTGRTVATVQPPKPYVTFTRVSGAADDRTFVLAAQTTVAYSATMPDDFFYARFSPTDGGITLTPLRLRGLPDSHSLWAVALSPDGTKLAVSSQNYSHPARITVYSLPGGAATTWSPGALGNPEPFGGTDTNAMTWSRTGFLAFDWTYGGRGFTAGEYLLNTNTHGGSLLADSRHVLCLPDVSISLGQAAGYLTADGTTIILGAAHPVPAGQRPSCKSGPLNFGPGLVLQEFSARTGQAGRVIYWSQARPVVATSQVYWSNPSGSVLVLGGRPAHRGALRWPTVLGIWHAPGTLRELLSGGRFAPIPGSASVLGPNAVGLFAF